MRRRVFHVYILANHARTLYIGMTSDLEQRISQHKHKALPGFTARYNINQLVRYEEFPTAMAAIEREKQLKGWTRAKKIALIESENPRWEDLAAGWEWAARNA
jgi:putative endonuclease